MNPIIREVTCLHCGNKWFPRKPGRCWGSFKPVNKRAPEVYKMLPKPYCLGVNLNGQPKHPLYVEYGKIMVPYKLEVATYEL